MIMRKFKSIGILTIALTFTLSLFAAGCVPGNNDRLDGKNRRSTNPRRSNRKLNPETR